MVLNANTEQETGKKAQLGNIEASMAVADTIRTCLGPKAMLKMLLSSFGLVITSDGNSILREVDISHPAAKSMIELSRAQDEEVGDGTTSVIILAGEMLRLAGPWLERNVHPTILIEGFTKALEDALAHMAAIAQPVDVKNDELVLSILKACIGTKFISRWNDLMTNMALNAVRTVAEETHEGVRVDIKRYVKIEKIPGGSIADSQVIPGVVVNKDVTHSKMRRRIENPRILLLDCSLEYKKGESQTEVLLEQAGDFEALLQLEEDFIRRMCDSIISFKPDVVITEKGLSDLAQHFLMKANITALRRFRKSITNRIAKASGATIVHRPEEIREQDIGTGCGLFEVRKIGDEYFTYITDCKDPGACTILLRGGSKDLLNEVERNLTDALYVARNILVDPRLLPGGGATEMSVAHHLMEKSKEYEGIAQYAYRSVSLALEVIPRTLATNAGASPVRLLTELRAKHAQDPVKNVNWGVDGNTGELVDMLDAGIWDSFAVKAQTLKTATESSVLLIRVDGIVSGLSAPSQQQ